MKVYPIRNHRRKYKDGQVIAHLFVFRSTKSNITYFIECEVFDKNVIAIKFYDKNHRESKNRFSYLTNSNEIWSVLHTCIQVIPILEKEHIGCSFVAIGAQGISPDRRQEQIEKTQRYLAYKRILFKLFESATNYALIDSDEYSALLMMNIIEFVGDKQIDDQEFSEKVLNKYVEIIELMEMEFLEIHNFYEANNHANISLEISHKRKVNKMLKILRKL
ncbi:hypothetical protein CO230_09380 [Chryseobacterium sp. 6424]|uniref:hypothetical protein n=1 Tax=Chryseobacterium sp. 6424 TaxID=2039166 RepID=UPI000EFD5791|nr:hypothetical protein [Chryseobacterium sp. 6424]AYO58309.1 hypothetical protein CO230_09380 [Chryseobacterium sp. 6424]